MSEEQRYYYGSMAMGPDYDPYPGAPEPKQPIRFIGFSTRDEVPSFYREEDFGGLMPGRPS